MKKDLFILLAGVLTTSLLFVIPAYFYFHWVALALSFLSATIFTSVLLRKKRGLLSRTYKIASGGILLLFFLAAALTVHNYIGAKKQKTLLVEVRQTIDTGIIGVEMRNDLLLSLKAYKANEPSAITVADAFRSFMGDQLNDDGTIQSRQGGEKEAISYHYEVLSPDKIKLISVTKVSSGIEPKFENYDGQTGMAQFEGILTNEGVEYEKVN